MPTPPRSSTPAFTPTFPPSSSRPYILPPCIGPLQPSIARVPPIRHRRITPCLNLPTVPRRHFSKLAASLATTLAFWPALQLPAAEVGGVVQTEADPMYGYSFEVPGRGWRRSTAGISAFREAIIYVCEEDGDSNVSVVTTPVPGDFQKLTSFGGLDNVIATLIPREGKDIGGRVIETKLDTANNAYVIEYAISSRGVERHLLTVFALQPGRYLVTLTGQAKEDNWGRREGVLRAVTGSFHLDIFS